MSAANIEGSVPPAQNQQQAQEAMVPQSRVNEIVSGARLDGEARARQLVDQQAAKIAQLEQQIAGIAQNMNGGSQNTAQDNGQDMSELVKQELMNQQKSAMQAEQRRQVDELSGTFAKGMLRGKEVHEDFDEITKKYNPTKFPEITVMAAQLENIPEVMYELNKNPMKLAYISELVRRDPSYAFEELKNLSQSLKDNTKAVASHSSPIKPLTGVKASTAGTDNSKRTVTDWKKFYRNKR